MRLSTTLPLALTLVPTMGLAHPKNNTSGDPLSVQMATSIISRHQGLYTPSLGSSGPLQAGFVQKAFTQLLALYPQHASAPQLSSYITQSADSLLSIFANASSAGTYSMDRLSSGMAFIALASQTGEAKYQRAVDVLKLSMDANRRNAQGGWWYYVYPEWSYLDGMFSLGPFWALHTATYEAGNATAWAELQTQFALVAARCAFEPDAGSAGNVPQGLLVHGYDESRTAVWANNSRGQSPHVWGRSLGWYVMGLLDTMTVIDAATAAAAAAAAAAGEERVGVSAAQEVRDVFAQEFHATMRAVAASADAVTGGWWQVVDQPGRGGNYIESSASAMFVYALLAGVRRGYLAPSWSAGNASFVDIGRRAYDYLKDAFVVDNGNGTVGWNGTVSVCSLNSTASYEYYTGRPIEFDSVLGSAAFVLASLEVERLEGVEEGVEREGY